MKETSAGGDAITEHLSDSCHARHLEVCYYGRRIRRHAGICTAALYRSQKFLVGLLRLALQETVHARNHMVSKGCQDDVHLQVQSTSHYPDYYDKTMVISNCYDF